MNNDLISIKDSCELLSVSRPTFNKYRKDYSLKEISFRRRVFFSKLEIIEKIIASTILMKKIDLKFTAVTSGRKLEELFLLDDVIDLRGNISLDAFGVISLLCLLKKKIKVDGRKVYLLVSDTSFCRHLKSVGFFKELERSSTESVAYNKDIIEDDISVGNGTVLLPLHLLGYKGAEKKVVEQLYDALLKQGFSEDLSGYLGWVVGELSDNCHTHSKAGPCYLMIESRHSKKIPFKFLSLVIGDIGIGIHHSLKTNVKYEHLSDEKAFVSSFLSDVSSWSDEHKRGKGLNDIMGIGIGNEAWIRCESCGIGMFANFLAGQSEIKFDPTCTSVVGTRVGLILIDNLFKDVSRAEVNSVLNTFLETM